MEEQVDLAEYLFTRLAQIGVQSIHGVPGDYNLQALDYIEPAGINWVGNANELNAGYAADGYGRIKGISALITAFGVGELSAINAIGGAFVEMSPVVHVVGTPPLAAQEGGVILHHSLGDGNFRVFANMYKAITAAQANLTDTRTAPEQIDRVLKECVLQSRPVYVELPTNLVKQKVSASRLHFPLDFSIPHNDEGFEDAEVDLILGKIYAAKQPFIIVDGFTSKYGIMDEADELVRITGFPTSTTPSGKGLVNESYPNFHGIYAGEAGKQVYRPWVESCDLILHLGPLKSDVNTYGFTTLPNPKNTIDFNRNSVTIGGTNSFSNVHVKPLLQKILNRMDKSRLPVYNPYPDLGNPRQQLDALSPSSASGMVDQETFWQRVSTYFRRGDIVLTETGTPSVGGRDFVLPPETTVINSGIWLSIGYMLGAAQGAAIAQRDILTARLKRNSTIPFPPRTDADVPVRVKPNGNANGLHSEVQENTPTPQKPDESDKSNSAKAETEAETTGPAIPDRSTSPCPPEAHAGTATPQHSVRSTGSALSETQSVITTHQIADRSFSGRTILFIGDGSLQMTAQAMSDMIRNRLSIVIIIINNDGYTIERFIHGMKAPYNDIQPWNYLHAPIYFGAPENDPDYPVTTIKATNWGEFWAALENENVKKCKGFNIVEVHMGREDAPDALKKLVASAARRNSGKPSAEVSTEIKEDRAHGVGQWEREIRLERKHTEERIVKAAGPASVHDTMLKHGMRN